MSGLSGIKSTPLCMEKDGIWLERIVCFFFLWTLDLVQKSALRMKEQWITLHISSVVYGNQKRQGFLSRVFFSFFSSFCLLAGVSPAAFQRWWKLYTWVVSCHTVLLLLYMRHIHVWYRLNIKWNPKPHMFLYYNLSFSTIISLICIHRCRGGPILVKKIRKEKDAG